MENRQISNVTDLQFCKKICTRFSFHLNACHALFHFFLDGKQNISQTVKYIQVTLYLFITFIDL